ncbi:hypothetical protein [Micromonospora sicca]|uniref:hypothetical protein n=1 Tax=Micromonospora sicca TaxID=2202420 RepID=UPI001374AB14|nr:hypothetical protein [Micromonospora sp. 4G51]
MNADRCITWEGHTIYAPEGLSVAEWADAASDDPAMSEADVLSIWEIAQAFADEGIM